MKTTHNDPTTQQWVSRLRGAAEGSPRAVRTRGAAEARLEQVIAQLAEQPREVRADVITALGDEPDEWAVTVLSQLVRYEPHWQLRLDIADALGRTGGEMAVQTLMYLSERDPMEDVRASAIRILGELAIRSHPELNVRTRGSRVSGAVRVRGAAPSKRVHPEAEAILALLDQIRHQDFSERVRKTADEVLGQLDE